MSDLLLDVMRVVLTGPTASGKSAIALELARRCLDAEIVSVDSMKVYRDMDIGTAKPSREARGQVPVHMIDVASPSEEYDMGRYVREARACLDALRQRGRRAIVVGGSMMYLRGLLEGVAETPPADPVVRQRLRGIASEKGDAFLHEELRRVDPASAARIHARDLKRIVRALEVYEKTGVPLSEQQKQWRKECRVTCPVAAIQRPKVELHARIAERVDRMIASGLVAEAERLAKTYPGLSREPRQAVGYREAFAYLRGVMDRKTMRDAICRRTRQLAKKQLTWLKHMTYATVVEAGEDSSVPEMADHVARVTSRLAHAPPSLN